MHVLFYYIVRVRIQPVAVKDTYVDDKFPAFHAQILSAELPEQLTDGLQASAGVLEYSFAFSLSITLLLQVS